MKEFKIFICAAALLFGTVMLIATFIVLFGYDHSSNDKSNKNAQDKTSIVSEPAVK